MVVQMARNLILFAPRSGSMFLNDIIRHKSGNESIGEPWILEKGQQNISVMYGQARNELNLLKLHEYHSEHHRREQHLLSTDNWIAKLNVFAVSAHSMEFVDRCVADLNTTVWLTHRLNITEQFLSYINALYRQQSLNEKPYGFTYRAKDIITKYDIIDWSAGKVTEALVIYLQLISHWQHVYNRYRGSVNLVSYEKHIKPMNLTEFGFTTEDVNNYNALENHLIPTPHNICKFNNDSIWPFCVDILNKHKYLVEI